MARTVQEFLRDDAISTSAGIAYYALFSLFPLLLALIALLSLFLDPAQVREQLIRMASQALPGSAGLVSENVNAVIEARGTIGLAAAAGLLWSSLAIFGAIRQALNRAWGVQRKRSFIGQKLLELAMALSIGLFFLASVAATAFFQVVARLGIGETVLWGLGQALLPLALSFLVFAVLYKVVPHTDVAWSDVWPGALVAALLFEAAKNLFAWYLSTFANYTLVYGSLAAVIALLFWAYLSAIILLLGAELSSEYARLFGSRRPSPAPIGANGAVQNTFGR